MMESYIEDCLFRFGYDAGAGYGSTSSLFSSTATSLASLGPIHVSSNQKYNVLISYYNYVSEFLVGCEFFERNSSDKTGNGGSTSARPIPPEKLIEEILHTVQYNVHFDVTDFKRGGFNIGDHAWKRFITPLHWLCKTVDELGLAENHESLGPSFQDTLQEKEEEFEKLVTEIKDAKETLIKIQEQQETLESEAETLTESITEGHKVYAAYQVAILESEEDIQTLKRIEGKLSTTLENADVKIKSLRERLDILLQVANAAT